MRLMLVVMLRLRMMVIVNRRAVRWHMIAIVLLSLLLRWLVVHRLLLHRHSMRYKRQWLRYWGGKSNSSLGKKLLLMMMMELLLMLAIMNCLWIRGDAWGRNVSGYINTSSTIIHLFILTIHTGGARGLLCTFLWMRGKGRFWNSSCSSSSSSRITICFQFSSACFINHMKQRWNRMQTNIFCQNTSNLTLCYSKRHQFRYAFWVWIINDSRAWQQVIRRYISELAPNPTKVVWKMYVKKMLKGGLIVCHSLRYLRVIDDLFHGCSCFRIDS